MLALRVYPVACGKKWQYTRIGPPQMQLLDFAATQWDTKVTKAAGSATERPPNNFAKPKGWSSLEDAIAGAASANGLTVDRDTLANGDCGPDAILRNLQRMQLQNQAAQEIFKYWARGAVLQHAWPLGVNWLPG